MDERRSEYVFCHTIGEAFYVHLDAFRGADSVSCLSDQFLEVHCVLVDIRPFHFKRFELVSGSLVLLGVCEGRCELCGELVPGILDIINAGMLLIQPVSYLSSPFLDQRSLDQREGEGNPGKE